MKKILFFFVVTIALASCQSDTTGSEKSIEEVQAMIIDNPVKSESPKKQIRREEAQTPTDTVNVAKMDFPEESFDFGTVDEGEVVKHTFEFTNKGKVPLIISNAKGSCGCTVPKWPQNPIGVGEKGKIEVSFNSKGRKNQQSKTVTLTANTFPVNTVLKITGNVTPDVQPAKEDHSGHDHSHDGHDHSGHDH